jgi:hypothetical protein
LTCQSRVLGSTGDTFEPSLLGLRDGALRARENLDAASRAAGIAAAPVKNVDARIFNSEYETATVLSGHLSVDPFELNSVHSTSYA